jgi:nucleotide-binding universal stress UspA family protein
MFKQIVVGVDEHDGGRDAIALARRLVGRDGELTLAHVYAGDAYIYRGGSAEYESAAREETIELLEWVRRETDVAAHLRSRESASVGRGLHELCEQVGADLLVVGSSRRGLLGRVLLGDDTRGALNGSPCAIAIAPGGYAAESAVMHEIGVGYDGSAESDHALQVAREVAAERGAKLSAFQAVSMPTTAVNSVVLPLSEKVDKLVGEALNRIRTLGDVEAHAAYGEAAEELAVYSASLDLLIVGSRGYGPIGRLIHGSTSRQLARLARCPLVVLPRGARPIETQRTADGNQTARALD